MSKSLKDLDNPQKDMEEKKYWIGFNFVKGIGAVKTRHLLNHFGKLSLAWEAPTEALMAAGLSEKIISHMRDLKRNLNLDHVVEKIETKEIKILTWLDEDYPKRLMEIDQPPPVLYYRGTVTPNDDWAIAIVGTRKMTSYGKQIAVDTARYLAANGITVISGLARGVDALAHQAALDVSGRTFAILGSGVDIIYPPEHKKLAMTIIENGALISDYPPGTKPEGINFPPRNRIISGLSRATIVVEAGDRSGALITARFANDQGRDVFAVPGSILSPMSRGTNKLISEGAIPLTNPSQVLDMLNYQNVRVDQTPRNRLPVEPTEARILRALGHEAVLIDELSIMLSMPIDTLSATLTMMELKGMVSQDGSMQYMAKREIPESYST